MADGIPGGRPRCAEGSKRECRRADTPGWPDGRTTASGVQWRRYAKTLCGMGRVLVVEVSCAAEWVAEGRRRRQPRESAPSKCAAARFKRRSLPAPGARPTPE